MRKAHAPYWIYVVVCLSLAACSDGSDGIQGETAQADYSVEGTAQKGPFLIGSTVDVSALSSTGQALDSSLTTETTDSLGRFSFTLGQPGPVLLTVSGHHYNELTGRLSDDQLTLRSIAEVTEPGEHTANVNILTHLIHGRVQQLMTEGATVSDAIAQAKREWLSSFSAVISDEQIDNFTQLDIFSGPDGGTGGGYLLSASVLFYQHATDLAASEGTAPDAKLAELLNHAADDFRFDGRIDDMELIAGLRVSGANIEVARIVDNLANRSRDVTGSALPVADISEFFKRLIIVFPAEDAVLADTTQIRVLGMQPQNGVSYTLLVDGLPVAGPADDNHFEWQPYFWSEDIDSRHTLIVEAASDQSTIYSNVVNVTVTPQTATVLQSESPPDAGTITNDVKPPLQWTTVPGAASYRVQLAEANGLDPFATTILDIETADTTLASPVLAKGQYVWRIAATDELDNTGIWSEPFTFAVAGLDAPQVDSLESTIMPSGQGQYVVGMSWGAVSNAVAYELEVARDFFFTTPIAAEILEVTNFQIESGPGEYFWRVRTIDRNGLAGDWTETGIVQAGVYEQQFGGSRDEFGHRILRAAAGGTIIVGSTKSFDLSDSVDSDGDDWIFELDDAGDIVWQYFWHAAGGPQILDSVVAADGAIYSAGAGLPDTGVNRVATMLKLDAAGNKVWKTSYSPPAITEHYVFTRVVDLAGQIYASGRIVANDGAVPPPRLFLHQVDPITGAVSDPIDVPFPAAGTEGGLGDLGVTASGELLVAGTDRLADLGLGCLGEGAFLARVDANLNVVSEWNNFGRCHHLNVQDVIELSNGRVAVFGQAENGGELAVSLVNPDGTEFATLIDLDFFVSGGNLIADQSGGFIAFVKLNRSPQTPTVVRVDDNLHVLRSAQVPNSDHDGCSGSFVQNSDATFTFLCRAMDSSGKQNILLIRRVFD